MTVPWWVVVAMVIVIGLAATIFLVRKDARNPQQRHSPALLFGGRFLALVFAVLSLIGTVINAIGMLISDTVQVALPVQQYWPDVYPWITLDPAPAASVVAGGFTTANVVVNGLGMDARLWLAAGNVAQGLTYVIIAAVLALLCHQLLGGSPFRPLLARSMMWMAWTIAVAGTAWQVFLEIGGRIASGQVLANLGWNAHWPNQEIADLFSGDPSSATGLPLPYPSFQVNGLPIVVGLALAAVAIAFRYSERLQKETEGLV